MKNKSVVLNFAPLILVAFVVIACGGGGGGDAGGTDTSPPSILTTVPSNGASEISVKNSILATFSEVVDQITVDQSTFILRDDANTLISGSISYSGTDAVLTPANHLAPSTTYTATILMVVTDLYGNHMANDYTWSFRTGSPPLVSATSPFQGEQGVDIQTEVTVTFNEDIDCSTIDTTTFFIKDENDIMVSGNLLCNASSASLTPHNNFSFASSYTATVTEQISDLSGNEIVEDYSWSFLTKGPSGHLDPDFGDNGIASRSGTGLAYDLAIQADGKIVAGGKYSVARYLSDGSIDLGFGSNGLVSVPFHIWSLVIQGDGKIIVAGGREIANNAFDFAVARLLSNGNFDTSFGNNGVITTPLGNTIDMAMAVAVAANGKIISAGYTAWDFALASYNANGSLDTTFGNGGKIVLDLSGNLDRFEDIEIQLDGKILVAGYTKWNPGLSNEDSDFVVIRFMQNGTLDNSFGSGGVAIVNLGSKDDRGMALSLQPDGSIVICGSFTSGLYGGYEFTSIRLDSSGNLDMNFGNNGIVITPVGNYNDVSQDLAIQSDGKIVVAGRYYNGSDWDVVLVRYNDNGTLDAEFGLDGISVVDILKTSEFVYAVSIQSDGKIVVGGDLFFRFLP